MPRPERTDGSGRYVPLGGAPGSGALSACANRCFKLTARRKMREGGREGKKVRDEGFVRKGLSLALRKGADSQALVWRKEGMTRPQ